MEKMDSKALFLDLDGTLLNDNREISAGNRQAVQAALAAGHRIVITTGRPLVSAIEQAKALDLMAQDCYLIAFNGGMIYDLGNGKIIAQVTVPLPLVQQVFAEANRRGIHIQTYDDNRILVEPRCDDTELAHYCQRIRMTSAVIPDILAFQQEPVKMLLIDENSQEPLLSFQTWLREHLGEQLDSFFSCDQFLEVVPQGMNKGAALLRLASLLGIPQSNTVAVGDAANDLSMIQAARVGVAMCNGTEEVRRAADVVTTRDNNHDGIAEVIETYLLAQH